MAEPAYAPLVDDILALEEEERRRRQLSLEQWIEDADLLTNKLEESNRDRIPLSHELKAEVDKAWRSLCQNHDVRLPPLPDDTNAQQALDYMFDVLLPIAFALKHPWLSAFHKEEAAHEQRVNEKPLIPPTLRELIHLKMRQFPGLNLTQFTQHFGNQLRPAVRQLVPIMAMEGEFRIEMSQGRAGPPCARYFPAEEGGDG